MLVSEVLNSNVYVQLVPNKSHSQELKNVLFVVVVVVQMNRCSLCHQVFNSVLFVSEYLICINQRLFEVATMSHFEVAKRPVTECLLYLSFTQGG